MSRSLISRRGFPARFWRLTGIDVLTHAIRSLHLQLEPTTLPMGFVCRLCAWFCTLPRAVANGRNDSRSREKMANAATIAGMVLGNSSVALAHALGHTAGRAVSWETHGNITAVFLPYTLQFAAQQRRGGPSRDDANVLHLPPPMNKKPWRCSGSQIFQLLDQIGLPGSLKAASIREDQFLGLLPRMVEHVEIDANVLMSPRITTTAEVEKLLRCCLRRPCGGFLVE
ncbi:MAG: iron-containing alcohol dehydrogenase [Chloroflexi bacterium]|nr:iron-containing alcohol dehydrogenase [Chloroflexota bacterium]